MDSQKLDRVSELYQEILDLANEQLTCLEQGKFAELPRILGEKAHSVNEAALLMEELKAQPMPADNPALQLKIDGLVKLVAKVVAIEDRCKNFVPRADVGPSARRVASLYKKF